MIGDEQPALFDEPVALARRGDPETSHAAAASVKDLRHRQWCVLVALRAYGPCTDEELAGCYERAFPRTPQSVSGLRTRRHELVAAGLVEWTGEKRPLASGRMARVWGSV